MNIILVDQWQGINYHRLIIPMAEISQRKMADVFIIQDVLELLNIDLTKVDRFIFSRHCDLNKEGHERISELLQEHDVKVIIDLDDYWVLPSDNTAHAAYESLVDPNQGIRKSIERSILMADHMWTPSPIIAKMARKVNPKITHTIVPNAINPGEGHWNMTKTFNSEKEVRFGYTGANNHMGDLELMGIDWTKHYTYTTTIGGYDKYLHANESVDALPLYEYGKIYENFNVSLAPLRSRKFDKCKSNLKAIEAGFTGCAFIGSNTTPYKEIIINGENGILCSNFEEWKEAIESLTPKDVKRLATNLYETVKDEYHIDNTIKIRANELQ